MQSGQKLKPPATLVTIRQRTSHSLTILPESVRQITNPETLTVNISAA